MAGVRVQRAACALIVKIYACTRRATYSRSGEARLALHAALEVRLGLPVTVVPRTEADLCAAELYLLVQLA